MIYTPKHTCRLCGATVLNEPMKRRAEGAGHLLEQMRLGAYPNPILHICPGKDGKEIGICDLVGFDVEA